MYEQISKNKRLSYVLIVVMTAFLIVFGFSIGYAATGVGWFGIVIAVAIAVAMTLTSYYKGDKIALATSHARQVTHDEAPQLFNVVEEMAIASGNPVPVSYTHLTLPTNREV